MSDWKRVGKQLEAEGAKISKVSGGHYARHAAHGAVMDGGVHAWELEFTSAASANSSRIMYVGVGREGLNVEKGNHHKKGEAWYLRTDNATLYGTGTPPADEQEQTKGAFHVGDRIGAKLNCDDGSLSFYKNGEKLEAGFPAGTISGPVVGAVELLCVGQALTLVPEATLP